MTFVFRHQVNLGAASGPPGLGRAWPIASLQETIVNRTVPAHRPTGHLGLREGPLFSPMGVIKAEQTKPARGTVSCLRAAISQSTPARAAWGDRHGRSDAEMGEEIPQEWPEPFATPSGKAVLLREAAGLVPQD